MVNEQRSGTVGKGVPAGYKLTEMEMIPEDWVVSTILNLTTNIIDYRGRTPKKLGMDWGDGDIVALSAANVKKGYIDLSTECYFGSEELYKRWMTSGHPQKGDIAFTMEAPLGNAASIPDNRKYILSQRTILLQIDRENFSPSLILQILLSERFQSYISESATGSTAQGIKRSVLEKLYISIPKSIVEQKAIANVLTNVDSLILSLEKLLSKKQSIKTATMQQLLTGKTRLPQFALRKDGSAKGYKKSELGEIPEDWAVNNIGDLFSITAGGDLRQSEFSNIQSEKHLYPIYSNAISHYGLYGYCQSYDYVGDYLTITARGGIGHAVARKGRFCAIGRLLVLSPKGDSNVKFYEGYINQYLSFANESTGVPQLTAPQVAKYPVVSPCIEEQTAIATILSDMDKEIQTLQQRLDKTRQLKQGMMQELLTGKTRLI
ncbi:restriction endonuclease subunit S [Escherichia coli]|nr:restriction endonuclease subunit S [Escherichia coli]KAE9778723.1 restriction endonuclease subunit S [Escherichia coli]MXJ49296.1 restriction endonuclease subunit S [Escherichia coli]HBA6567481.1 restriction endonuclease subunit S [Escherichia coli]